MKKLKIKFDSINSKLIMVSAFIILPIIVLLFIESNIALKTIQQQASETNELLIVPYIKELDTNLNNAKRYISNSSYSEDFSLVDIHDDIEKRRNIKELSEKWNTDFLLYPLLDGIYMYTEEGQYLSMQNPKGNYSIQILADDYIKNDVLKLSAQDNPFQNGWMLFKAEDKYFIKCSIRSSKGIFGAWISLDTIKAPLDEINSESISSISFVDKDGNIIISSGADTDSKDNNITILGYSDECPVGISADISRGSILGPTENIRRFSIIFSIVSIVLFIAYMFYMKFSIIRPIQELANTMNSIVDDTVRVKVNKKQSIREFRMLFDTFDRLIDRIRKLKIDVYEEKINKQKAQMQFLQLQIKPHFFLNSLNVILSFFDMGENDMAEKMLICLAKHFRYLLHDGNFIEIGEEIEHTKNYLQIQQMRFEKTFSYKFEVEDFIMSEKIPLLCIQTFVENSVRHITDEKTDPEINISIKFIENNSKEFIRIIIKDNGDGFKSDILEKLNNGEQIVDEHRKHIGIYNVRKRLEQLYGGKASLKFYNGATNGAVTEILIPKIQDMEEK